MKYTTHNVPWNEINDLGKLPYNHRIQYGKDALQFGELRLPKGKGPFPIAVFIHGGCWLSAYNLDYVSVVCADLATEGYAVWTPEYRRVGDEGGGYPNTFKDARQSIYFLRKLAKEYPLDLEKIVLLGHSAGGHLALWLATQQNLPNNSPLHSLNPLVLKGVISLAGITDLVAYHKIGNDCSTAVVKLMDGNVDKMTIRYTESSPIHLLPASIPTRLVHGDLDNIVPLSQSENFVKKSKEIGDDSRVIVIEGGGHFDMASPYSEAWKVIKKELKILIGKK